MPIVRPISTMVRVHCTGCNVFVEAVPEAVEGPDGDPENEFCFTEHDDIAWIRRRRTCSQCGTTFDTAEVDERLLDELARLRKEAAARGDEPLPLTAAPIPGSTLPNWMTVDAPDVPLSACRELVEASAWWLSHPSGAVRAPRMANHVEWHDRYGYVLPLGANKFAVALAIQQAGEVLKSRGSLVDAESARDDLKDVIADCVLSSTDELYPPGTYRRERDDLIFGVQSIDVADAAEYIIAATY